MNRFRTYLHVHGNRFDPHAFRATLPDKVAGTVNPFYRVKDGVKTVVGHYWTSTVTTPSTTGVEDELLRLLRKYSRHLIRARKSPSTRMYAVIAADMDDIETLRGYFISKALIQALFKHGVELDISIVGRRP